MNIYKRAKPKEKPVKKNYGLLKISSDRALKWSREIILLLILFLSISLLAGCLNQAPTPQQPKIIQGNKWQRISERRIDSTDYYSCLSCQSRFDSCRVSTDTIPVSDTTIYFFHDSATLIISSSTAKAVDTFSYSLIRDTISLHQNSSSADSLITIPVVQFEGDTLTLDESAFSFATGIWDPVPPVLPGCDCRTSSTILLKKYFIYRKLL